MKTENFSSSKTLLKYFRPTTRELVSVAAAVYSAHDCPQFLHLLLLLDCVSLTVGADCLGLPCFVTLFMDNEWLVLLTRSMAFAWISDNYITLATSISLAIVISGSHSALRLKPLSQWLFWMSLIRRSERNVSARSLIAFTVRS